MDTENQIYMLQRAGLITAITYYPEMGDLQCEVEIRRPMSDDPPRDEQSAKGYGSDFQTALSNAMLLFIRVHMRS